VEASGTHDATWALSGGVFYFTTPIVAYGTLTKPFSVYIGNATFFVFHTAYGRATGDYVNFPESPGRIVRRRMRPNEPRRW